MCRPFGAETLTDTRATRDPDDPHGEQRDSDEEALLLLLMALLGKQRREVIRLLGDPPDLSRLPQDFWATEGGRMIAAIRPEVERMALDATARTTAPTVWEETALLAAIVAWAATHTQTLVDGLNSNTRRLLEDKVRQWLQAPGGNIAQLGGQLEALFGERRARSIAVTETTNAYGAGATVVADELRRAGVRAELRWHTAHDEKVCSICGPNHNRLQSQGWTVAGVPAHPNCRCRTTIETRG